MASITYKCQIYGTMLFKISVTIMKYDISIILILGLNNHMHVTYHKNKKKINKHKK